MLRSKKLNRNSNNNNNKSKTTHNNNNNNKNNRVEAFKSCIDQLLLSTNGDLRKVQEESGYLADMVTTTIIITTTIVIKTTVMITVIKE